MRKTLLLSLLLPIPFLAYTQQPAKKPLDHQVYDSWQSISSHRISNNGQWVSYSVEPQQGDAKLSITNLKTKAVMGVERVSNAVFTEDSKYAVFTIKPYYQETRAAKIKKKKADDMPKDTLGIVTLGKPGVVKIGRVKSFKIPEQGSGVVAYLMEKGSSDTARKKTTSTKADRDYLADEGTSSGAGKTEGSDLVIYNLATGMQKTFKYVTEYALSNKGRYLVFASSGAKKDSLNIPGLFWYDTEAGSLKRISSGRGNYKNLTFDDSDKQFAFTAETSPEKALQKFHSLYYYTPSADSARVIADKGTPGMPANWSVNGEGRAFFSKNAAKLFFGTAPILAAKDTSIVEFEVAKVDIWNYQDDYLQPMQLKNMERDLNRSYMAVIFPERLDAKVIQLGTEEFPDIELGDEGNSNLALLSTDKGYRISMQWTGSTFRDLYLVSTSDGSRRKIASKVRGANLSPKANYVTWYDRADRNWYLYNIKTGTTTALNQGLDTKFYNELNDMPDDPSPYGMAGWTEDEQQVLIYDRFDIWSFGPLGGTPKNITNGYGRKNQTTLRYQDFEPERSFRRFSTNSKVFDLKSPIWLDAFNHVTKQNGWYLKDLRNNRDPKLQLMAPFNYSKPAIAKNSTTFIYTKSNYKESPDLYASSDFNKETRLTAINPQQLNYNWGTAELVKWTTPKGYKSEGILYKPEDFDVNRKYPMIVYFYEKLSDGLYNYIAPTPTPSRLNISYFVSNGYLVFAPDISYEIGYPGRSAEEFVNSGVESLKKNMWVDGSRVGLQGQSWGGYQIAHLITRTDMYAAAWAGAPVVNMTSAYGGIRWDSGMNRQFQYEKSQSRIGATLWEKPELYIENSPLFHLPKVNTPVVIMANDADGAVPWYQGIEMFTALRRLNKPVWMLNYNNEAHNLVQRQNRKDIQIREQQFFDHYLKGKPAPYWMDKGVPATDKGKNWGFEISEPATVDIQE